MWMYDHWEERKVNKSFKYRLLFAFNVFQIVAGTFIMVAGVSNPFLHFFRIGSSFKMPFADLGKCHRNSGRLQAQRRTDAFRMCGQQ